MSPSTPGHEERRMRVADDLLEARPPGRRRARRELRDQPVEGGDELVADVIGDRDLGDSCGRDATARPLRRLDGERGHGRPYSPAMPTPSRPPPRWRPRTRRRPGVLRAGVPRRLRRAGLRAERPRGRRRRPPGRPGVLHQPRQHPRAGAGRGRGGGVRRVQPRRRRPVRRPRVDADRRRDDQPVPDRRRRRPAASRPRRRAGRTDADQRTARPRRRAAATRGAGRCSPGCAPSACPTTRSAAMWRRGDLLREYRGDSHIAAWVSAGLDATEIGLLTELYWGLPMRTYARTRAWTDDQFDAATERLKARGLVADGAFTTAGRELARGDRDAHRRADAQDARRARRRRR